jgi:LysR substrate binding domain.
VIQAAASGLGVALSWRSLVADELHSGRLISLLGTALPTDRAYHLVTLNHRLAFNKVQVFRQWLQEQALLPTPYEYCVAD